MWWEKVKELIEYARGEKPDAYEVLRMANEIAAKWNEHKPPTTNDPDISIWIQRT
jgi:hypothetical protein